MAALCHSISARISADGPPSATIVTLAQVPEPPDVKRGECNDGYHADSDGDRHREPFLLLRGLRAVSLI
jgi:hypothetical protein